MIPAALPDEDLRGMLDGCNAIDLLFPFTTGYLVHVAAEWTHRFAVVHRATTSIGRAAHLNGFQDVRETFTVRNLDIGETIARWRTSGVSWTRRRPPRCVPPREVLHVPAPGTKYHWDNVGHETYRYKYKVLKACSDAVIMQDLDRTCAVVAPTYDRLREYVPDGPVQMQYVFGVRPCGWYSPT